MKIVIAIDSFKGSISSLEASQTIKQAIKDVLSEVSIKTLPLADGGEGTMNTLLSALNGEIKAVDVFNPLMTKISANYGLIKDANWAIIEMAQASGLEIIEPHLRNPMKTTTYGVGQLIIDALNNDCRHFIVGIGGSATSDCGIGMLQALGYKFYDKHQSEILQGAQFIKDIVAIDSSNADSRLKNCTFRIACDVDNPLYGPNGAAHVYALQKGATLSDIEVLDNSAIHFANIVFQQLNTNFENVPGTGAAGGLGFAFISFLNAKLESGIDIVMSALDLEKFISAADLVITGEGKLDGQTIMGKAPIGVAKLAKKYHKPVIAFTGATDNSSFNCNQFGIDAYFSIINQPMPLIEAMQKEIALTNLYETTVQVFNLLKIKGGF